MYIAPIYANHIEDGYQQPLTVSDLGQNFQKNYQNQILIGAEHGSKINISKLSQDVHLCMNTVNTILSRETPPLPPPDPRITEMQARIEELEEIIRKIEFMVGEN